MPQNAAIKNLSKAILPKFIGSPSGNLHILKYNMALSSTFLKLKI
jgi:hypothetical protein